MGWDIDRFPEGEVHLELVCCICTCVLEEPVESPCRHVFCSKCIRTWLSNQKSCPQCRATVHKKDLISALPALKNIISKQRIFCEFKELGCPDIVPLEQLATHTMICQYGLVSCLNLGCNTKVLRKDHKSHSEVCAKRMVLCEQGCEMFFTVGERATHNCIRSLYSHFQEVTNELLSRISKLEEQVNILTSKSNQCNQTPCLRLSDEIYMAAPFSIPSPRPYEMRHPSYTVNDHRDSNITNLTSYPIENSDLSDVVESVDSDGPHEITPPSSPAVMSNIYNQMIQNSSHLRGYLSNLEHSASPSRQTNRRTRQVTRRSRSPQIRSGQHFQQPLDSNYSRTRSHHDSYDGRRIRFSDNERRVGSDEPIVLRIGVSQTISETSSSSTESDTE